jgi:hypothetical protein
VGNERRNEGDEQCAIGPPLCWAIYTVSVAAECRSGSAGRDTRHNQFYFIIYFILSGPRAQEDKLVYSYSLHSLTRGRHPSHQGRRHRFSLSSSSVLNRLSFGCVFHLYLLLSPARVTRDSINSTCPNYPTFPVRAALPNFLTNLVPSPLPWYTYIPCRSQPSFFLDHCPRWPTIFPSFSSRSPPMRFPTIHHYLLNLVAKSITSLMNGGRRTYGGHGET